MLRKWTRFAANKSGMTEIADRISRLLQIIVVLLLLLLAASQLAMQSDAVRHLLTGTERWEGKPLYSGALFCIRSDSVV